MAHIRRKFFDCIPEAFANEMVKLIQRLCDIEELLRLKEWSDQEKAEYRHEHARPILQHLYELLDKATASALYTPKSHHAKQFLMP